MQAPTRDQSPVRCPVCRRRSADGGGGAVTLTCGNVYHRICLLIAPGGLLYCLACKGPIGSCSEVNSAPQATAPAEGPIDGVQHEGLDTDDAGRSFMMFKIPFKKPEQFTQLENLLATDKNAVKTIKKFMKSLIKEEDVVNQHEAVEKIYKEFITSSVRKKYNFKGFRDRGDDAFISTAFYKIAYDVINSKFEFPKGEEEDEMDGYMKLAEKVYQNFRERPERKKKGKKEDE